MGKRASQEKLDSMRIENEIGICWRKTGIETRTFFIPMHEQPVFQNMGLF